MPDLKVPGPTGKFCREKPTATGDLGGLYAVMSMYSENPPMIALDFGVPLTWTTASPEDVVLLAKSYRDFVWKRFGRLGYDIRTLPISVIADKSHNVVKSTLPATVEVLVANPEVYLAWAEVMETAARELTPSH